MTPVPASRAARSGLGGKAAETTLADGQRLAIKDVSVQTDNVMAERPNGQISLTASGDLAPFLETVQSLPIRNLRDAPKLPKAGEGKVDAHFDIKVPFIPNVSGDDISVSGKARITDGRFGKVAGRFDVQGFTLNLDLTDTTLDAKGDLLVNGVPAKIAGQRLLGPKAGQQPPIKIMAKLDDADRTQLGLDINDIVQGVVPIEVLLEPAANGPLAVKLHADLTFADMTLDHLQWHKAAGRTASVDAEIVSNPNHDTELQRFKISSDDIAAEGKIVVGSDNKIKQFEFPNLMLNVVSRLDVKGSRGKDDMWSIDASGKTFDGRNFFRSLFNVGNGPDRKGNAPGAAKGARVNVQIDNVIGGYDVSLRNLKMRRSTPKAHSTAARRFRPKSIRVPERAAC